MTYYYAESAVAGNNQQKLVIEVWTTPDVNAINWDTNTVQIRALARTYQAKYSGDNQTFNRTGSWSGSNTYYMPATANTWVTLADQTWNVSTQQGSGVHLDIDGNITGHYGGASFYTGVDVDIAARPYPASQPTLSANNFDMGTTVTINTNPLNGGFTHNLYFYVGGTEVYRAMGVGASTTWNFPVATLGPYAPSSTVLAGIIYCDTMNGGSLVGSSSVGWTANVPSSVVPSITATNVSDDNATVVSNVAQYVKLLSKLKVQLTGCAGVYGSSIAKHEVTVNNITYDITNLASAGASSLLYTFTTAIMSSGTVDVIGKVTDSRGRAATKTNSITVLDYSLPNPAGFVIQRCDSAGTLNTLGTYVKVTIQGTTKSLVNSTERNNLAYQVDYRQVGTTPWLALKAKTTQAALTLNLTQTLGTGQFSAVNSYEFRFTLYDKFNNVAITTTMGTSEVTLSLNKIGIGVGKVWQKGSVDAKDEIFQQDLTIPPSGTVVAFAGSAAPTGWLLANGSAVSRTTYARLFAVIGTAFGAGDGSTTFNLPNFNGKVAVGRDSTQTEFDTLGETGGSKTHQLTIDEMPQHDHNPPNGYFYVESPIGAYRRSANINNSGSTGEDGVWRQRIAEYAGAAGAMPTESTGGGQAHNNLQPYIVLNYIIKT